MQTKSKNYEICQDVMISYAEIVVNSWKVSRNSSRLLLTNRRISGEVSES
jgi:hypothetical protein